MKSLFAFFSAVLLTANAIAATAISPAMAAAVPESLPAGLKVVGLEVAPASVRLHGCYDSVQLLVTAKLADGTTADVTRLATYKLGSKIGEVMPGGRIDPLANGKTQLSVSIAGKSAKVPIEVVAFDPNQKVDFIRDVNPVIAYLGCSSGACHGAKDGKAGFKLSLRGYDPIFDVRSFVDDHAGRRVNFASPDDSLMLLKATGAVPHEGGQRTKYDDKYYRIMRAWIADGAKLDLAAARVTKIEVTPRDPVLQAIGSKQQMRIIATYADGRQRDVTAEAFIESGNVDVVATERGGLVSTLRRGEAPVLARYEGNYAATTVTVMGDRSGFAWKEPEKWNKIDEFTAEKWQRMKILPSELCTDVDFLRRVYLDLTGLPPTAAEVRAFLADTRDVRVKRDEVIDRLIGGPDYVDHWANKWADLLQVNRKFLGEDGARRFREWIREEIASNTPYDQFTRKILTASGSNRENPAASYYKVLRTPTDTMENTTHLFLATRFNCNKCHDHPFERWTQDQYYELSAFFAQVDLKKDPESGNKTIAGSAVEGAKPLYEIAYDKTEGDVKHDRTGQITPPQFPFPAKFELNGDKATRRERLAAWIASPDNRYFALSYVNRMWGYLMGVGLIDPLDDIRAGNPPSNPELLQWLTQQFVQSGFNVRHIQKLICSSRTYQLAVTTHKWNADDKINYSHATARRLPAEVLFDAVLKVTGSIPNFPGVKAGTRAAQLPDSAIDVPSGFLGSLGRPARESACECERSSDIGLGSVMALLSGPAVSGAINDPKNELAKLAMNETDDRKLVDEIFLRTLNRHATDKEIATALKAWSTIDPENTQLKTELAKREEWWAPVYVQKQKEREQAIAAASLAVAARMTEIAPQVAEAEKKREEAIVAKTESLRAYDEMLTTGQEKWEDALDDCRKGTAWVPLKNPTVKATGNVQLKKQEDGSYLATGPTVNGVEFTVSADSPLEKITGVMLEVLPDDSLPAFGPGRANGNFVLSDFILRWGGREEGRPPKEVKFRDARADYSQARYDVKDLVRNDGQRDAGWGVGGKLGEPHYARLGLSEPITAAEGGALTFVLRHRFRDGFYIGRFRLWVTSSQEPLELGLPVDIQTIVKTPRADRTQAQRAALLAYASGTDVGRLKQHQALYKAKLPVPEDPKLTELKAVLAKAELRVPIDSKLVQLRADAEMSTKQLANQRLTGAQDLAWAIINNPAFLFNR
jgi:hypothetical protein